ncbi:hypothetical protein BDN67DRAFT_963212 [Paxillus ammoniavirescens]|nr:hypothetical protein BDN67DRAFT_963212 [Paxillus ammoniavirescens]
MSFDDLNSSVDNRAPNGRQSHGVVDLECDVTFLGSLIAESDQNPTNDSELSELLARLDSADGMARGVESRLDEILGTLDNLLTSLEPKDDKKSQDPPPILQPANSPPEKC